MKAEGYDVNDQYYDAYILLLLPRLSGVGQAIAESISCLLPEMAVAMPKILHLPIFGILSALTSCFAFCPFCRPSASFKLRSSARTRRNSFLRVQNRFSCVRQVNRYFSLIQPQVLRRAGRLFHTKRSALILRFSLSCSTTLHPKQSPVDPYSDPDSNMVRRYLRTSGDCRRLSCVARLSDRLQSRGES